MKLEANGSIHRINITCDVDIRTNSRGSQMKKKRRNFLPRERPGRDLKTDMCGMARIGRKYMRGRFAMLNQSTPYTKAKILKSIAGYAYENTRNPLK